MILNRSALQKVPRSAAFLREKGFILLGLVLLKCAGQIPPGGGPPDTTPPAVIRTFPDTNAVRVETNRIELEFSEYVDRRSVEESIFISPYLGQLEFDWGGTEVAIFPSEKLREGRTYVLNVGTDVVDVRARNRMASGFTLAFSTGDSIDRGLIRGRVFDEKAEGVMVFAYLLTNINPDTLDPSKLKPDYIMQTGKDGTFTLANLAFGVYRLLAVRDEYRNLVYDKQVDQYGVTAGDLVLDAQGEVVKDVWFRLAREDTAKPFLTSAQALTARQVQARFSEPLDSLSFGNAVFEITDTLTRGPVAIRLRFFDRAQNVGIITTTALDSGVAYRLHVSRAFDRAGNPIDTAHADYIFQGVGTADTVRPTINVLSLSDSSRGWPLDRSVEIQFSKPVSSGPLVSAVSLLDSARKPVSIDVRPSGVTSMLVMPKTPLMSKAWYSLSVKLDSAHVIDGNGFKRDSTFSLRFETLDLRSTGSLEGSLADDEGERGAGDIYVTATGCETRPAVEKTIRMTSPGRFAMEHLPEGRYAVRAFRDADSSASYTEGRPFPFIPSERFVVYPDTVRVRARWGVEGVTIRLRARPDQRLASTRQDTVVIPRAGVRSDSTSVPEQTPPRGKNEKRKGANKKR